MLKLIYIGFVLVITIWTIYIYYKTDGDFNDEIKRINYIENKRRNKNDFLNYHRLNSLPCDIKNLNDPKECYLKSNYKCKWSELSDRCNKIQ